MLNLKANNSVSAVSKHLIPDLPSVDEVLPYLRRIDEMRWYSNFGPLVCEFEERLKSLLSGRDTRSQAGQIHLTTLVSCHHALEVGLHLFGIDSGKAVLIPALTHSSCPLAVLHTGADVVLADVDPISWTLTPQIARATVEHTHVDAVIPVAIYGVPLPTAEWDQFKLETGIPVIIDAATAIDAQSVPEQGLVAYSLHATKPFGIGEGGVLVGRDPELIARGRQFSNFGTINRVSYTDGTNAKMSEFHAAVGLAQLSRWPEVKQRRSHLLQLYIQHLEELAESAALHPAIQTAVVCSLMLLLSEPIAEAIHGLSSKVGIGFHRTYLPPLYHHPYFERSRVVDSHGMMLGAHADAAKKKAHMLCCEKLTERLLGVPFHPFMDETDVASVVNTLRATGL